MSTPPDLAICCSAAQCSEREQALAEQLQLPLIGGAEACPAAVAFFLRYDHDGLTLHQNIPRPPGGLCVDFNHPDLIRRSSDKLKQQNLCKAVGLKGLRSLHILDAMAGLGRDAWLLAQAGAEVDMLERSPVVFSLLHDALSRSEKYSAVQAAVLQRMRLRQADFLEIAATLPRYDVVYLDPMFPPKGKQARAKNAMYLLQLLLDESAADANIGNESTLLQAARSIARRRVVVKRAKLSPYLAGCKPDIEFRGSANRFDVYLCHAPNMSED